MKLVVPYTPMMRVWAIHVLGGFEEVKADDEAPEEEEEDNSSVRAGTRSSVDRSMVDGGCGTGDEADDSESGRRVRPGGACPIFSNGFHFRVSPNHRSSRGRFGSLRRRFIHG